MNTCTIIWETFILLQLPLLVYNSVHCLLPFISLSSYEYFPQPLVCSSNTLINQQSEDGGGVSTPCGAVSTRGITVLFLRLLKLYVYGSVYDPGMGHYPPRVQWDLDASPRGKIRSALAL